MNRDFFEFSQEQYRQEMKESAAHYQKGALMLILLPLLCTAIWNLGVTKPIHELFTRCDLLFYYLSVLVAVLSIIASWYFLFRLVNPRKYSTLENMDVWKEWREKYEKYLKELKAYQNEGESEGDSLEAAWMTNITEKLVEAQPVNAKINEERRIAFGRSVRAAAIAVAAIGFQAFLYFILTIQGVINE